MLDSVHGHDAGCIVDAVDDPVVTSAGGEQAVQLSNEWLAESVRILADRTPHGDERGVTNLGWELVEVAETFWGDPDLVRHPGGGSGGRQREQLAARGLGSRPGQGSDEVAIGKDVEGLLERLEIVRAHEHERRSSVSGHQDPLVLSLDALRERGQVGLSLRERQRVCHRSLF